ncbi:MAG TPA: glycosyltransferase [Candidatus Doudnabacteria bacterium]|nr:glycosyltransferase [Candidatus Doudnabacteria bacterium]
MSKKILILYTSVGLGHKFIAENIGYYLKQAGHDVMLHDILEIQDGTMVKFGTWIHSFINRRIPSFWRWMYFSNLLNTVMSPLRLPLARTNSENLFSIVKQFSPDCILSTQTTASAATASLIRQKKFNGKFIIAFSDYHLHKFWLYDEADLYLANTEQQKQEMISLGVSDNKIIVCGITLQPKSKVNSDQLREEIGIASDKKIVVFGSGSLGIGFDYNLLKNFLAEITNKDSNIVVVVLCGKNESLKAALQDENLSNVLPLGFFQNPSRLYQVAELLVTKPGGLTIAEALQSGVKILITHTLPGQEEPNYEYLVSRNLVFSKPNPLSAKNLSDTVMTILSSEQTSNPEESQKITNFGDEGKTLIGSVNNLFHNV